jgi:hypothetical protein
MTTSKQSRPSQHAIAALKADPGKARRQIRRRRGGSPLARHRRDDRAAEGITRRPAPHYARPREIQSPIQAPEPPNRAFEPANQALELARRPRRPSRSAPRGRCLPRQPGDRRMVHSHSSGDLPAVFTGGQALEGLVLLVIGQLLFAPELDGLGRGKAGITAPGELPIELNREYKLIVNLKTAHALGLTVPPTLLARADEVLE